MYLNPPDNAIVLRVDEKSQIQALERSQITNKQIRRGSYESVAQLTKAIKDYIKNWNKSGRSFKRTKQLDEIIAKINKAKSF